MNISVLSGVLLPFIGTSLGAASVFVMKKEIGKEVQRVLTGFAAGVMVAASVWSLLIPSMNHAENMGKWAFVPAVVGFLIGVFFLLFLDTYVPHMHLHDEKPEGVESNFSNSAMLMFAVTLHNIPEGMAVGVVLAGWLSGEIEIAATAALTLALGIAIQNFPEGAIISLPLRSRGESKGKSFTLGLLSGIVEPISAVVTLLLATYVIPVLPYLLSFAAGAMIYVVVEELIPEMSEEPHSNVGTIAFAIGFCLMMILDTVLG